MADYLRGRIRLRTPRIAPSSSVLGLPFMIGCKTRARFCLTMASRRRAFSRQPVICRCDISNGNLQSGIHAHMPRCVDRSSAGTAGIGSTPEHRLLTSQSWTASPPSSRAESPSRCALGMSSRSAIAFQKSSFPTTRSRSARHGHPQRSPGCAALTALDLVAYPACSPGQTLPSRRRAASIARLPSACGISFAE